jgi:uncharacterized membrane protein YraQ (UPF0718 family)
LATAVFQNGFTSVSHVFVMEWSAIVHGLVIGLLIAGAVAAWVPNRFWESFFITDHPTLAAVWGPIVGPIVVAVAFVCSIRNVPLAAVLWNGGISFGGVVPFIFADLLILPILNIYRKYYGTRMMFVLLGTFYASMVVAGYIVELLFGATGSIPRRWKGLIEAAAASTDLGDAGVRRKPVMQRVYQSIATVSSARTHCSVMGSIANTSNTVLSISRYSPGRSGRSFP